MKKILFGLSLAGAMSFVDVAQAAPVVFTGTYTQDFNTLASTGTGTFASLPTGVEAVESGTGANTTYTAGTGSSATGDTYSFGTAAGDRAFGTLQSGANIPTIGFHFTNGTGSLITTLNITYAGEQYRLGATGRVDRLDFQYSTTATALTTGTYTDEDNGDFTAPVTTGTVGAIDGNALGNFTNINFNLAGLNIADGSDFFFRFTDFNATGADDGLAIDNFLVTTATPEPETWAMMALGVGALAMFGWKRRRNSDEASLPAGLAI